MNITFEMPAASNVPTLAREAKVTDIIINCTSKKITAVVQTRFLDINGDAFGNAENLPGMIVHQSRGTSEEIDDFLDLEEDCVNNPTAAKIEQVCRKILEFNNIIEPIV